MTMNQPGPFQPQGPQAYASSTATLPPRTPPQPKRSNGLALAALIMAGVGFICAVIKWTYLLGWILLPISFVLAIVALFQRDKAKKLAVTALIVSIVGSIAGGISFAFTAAKLLDEAARQTQVTAAPPVSAPAPEAAQPTTSAPAGKPAGQQGTREKPYPIGTKISSQDWTVTIDSFKADATKEVMKENEFNDKVADGHTYALVQVTATYTGDKSGTPLEIDVNYVTSAGNTIKSTDKSVVAPNALGFNDLYKGASTTGNVVLQVPKNDNGVLRVRPGFIADEVFVAIR